MRRLRYPSRYVVIRFHVSRAIVRRDGVSAHYERVWIMYQLTVTKSVYNRTESGKGWRSVADSVETETLPWDRRDVGSNERHGEDVHRNITDADTLRWFRRLGGSEYAERSYTPMGYIITRLISTSPDRETRHVRTFRITQD